MRPRYRRWTSRGHASRCPASSTSLLPSRNLAALFTGEDGTVKVAQLVGGAGPLAGHDEVNRVAAAWQTADLWFFPAATMSRWYFAARARSSRRAYSAAR